MRDDSDDFDIDSFEVDDSFLREVDDITARAVAKPVRSVSLAAGNGTPAKAWTGPQRSVSSASVFPPSSKAGASTAFRAPQVGSTRPPPRGVRSLVPSTRPTIAPRTGAPTPAQPYSDDYDSLAPPLPTKSLVALDSDVRPCWPTVIPSSRLVRTSSGSSGFLQIHLNFRKENQATKGKRWDRTVSAERRGRIWSNKAKMSGTGKGKRGWDDDENDSEEGDDWGVPLAPYPKPLVDPNKPYEPQRHLPNASTINTYIYPTNRPRRDYQFDIVRACFTDNCLVALPTGLGKTLVAGVVMLNFYRWFPTGKIVFLAPTKPLVNQQIEACQMTCGIPSKDAAVMTGQSVSAKERARLWNERRVFYCTPQTLDNDLKKGSIDPRDIVLAVFDEAHKASGSYAYTTILAYITAHHPFFRVLALTATPGADVPRVQAVVDALHISRIEIREAEAPEIRKYMNEKRTERHFVQMGEVIEDFRERWAALMKPYVTKLVEKDILTERDLDVKRLKPFRLTAKRMEIGRDRTSGLRWCMGSLQSLERMARAMGHLLEFSIGMFHTLLLEISGGQSAAGKKSGTKGGANAMRNNFEFQKLLRDVEVEMNCIRIGKGGKTKADRHPKMVKTLELLLAHFTQAADDERLQGIKNDTRAMVFCSFRDCVLEVVDMLNDHSPVLRATKFVGQAQGKQEVDKGFNQKEQKRTISEFKEGRHNILVSTSIGEEGLDIGEVDFVVIYDMPKQSIKLLQRVGRTGRKRNGQVHVLMSEGREDGNWDTAQATHREIQEEILHSRNLELFEDVERLLPPGKLPKCVEEEMPVDPWDPEDQKARRRLPSAGTSGAIRSPKEIEGKGKTEQRGNGVPKGAEEGFKSVAQLLREAGRDIGGDEEVAAEEDGQMSREKGKGKGRGEKRGRSPSPIRSKKKQEEVKDEAERDLLYGAVPRAKKVKNQRELEATKEKRRSSTAAWPTNLKGKAGIKMDARATDSVEELRIAEEARRKAEKEEFNRSALDFFNTQGPTRRRPPTPENLLPSSPRISPSPSLPPTAVGFRLPRSTMNMPNDKTSRLPLSPNTDESLGTVEGMTSIPQDQPYGKELGLGAFTRLTPRTAAAVGFSQIEAIDLSWDDEDLAPSPVLNPGHGAGPVRTPYFAFDCAPPSAAGTSPMIPVQPSRPWTLGLARPRPNAVPSKSMEIMPPPPILAHHQSSPASTHFRSNANAVAAGGPTTPVLDPTQFPVRRPGRRHRVILSSSERDSGEERGAPGAMEVNSPLPCPERLRRRILEGGSSPTVQVESPALRRRRRNRAAPKRLKTFLDLDAELSGSDSGDEPFSPSHDIETESDRQFASEFQPTQAPKGYNQHAIYLAGLSTQAARRHGLEFQGDKWDRERRDRWLGNARRPVWISQEAEEGEGEEDGYEYELGSFVCPDEDVSFDTQSERVSPG